MAETSHWQTQIKDEDWAQRYEGAKAMVEAAPDDLEQRLLSLRDDPNAKLRSFVCKSLGMLFDAPETIPLLIEALEDPVNTVRAAAVKALARQKARQAVPRLNALLQDPDHNVRQAAAGATGKLLCPTSIPHLLKVYQAPAGDDHSAFVKRAAEKALSKFGLTASELTDTNLQPSLSLPSDVRHWPKHVQKLLEQLWSQQEREADKAAKALGNLRDPALVPFLLRGINRTDEAVRAIGVYFRGLEEEGEQMAFLRSMLVEPITQSSLWLVLCELLDSWPDPDGRELASQYIQSHIAHWPADIRHLPTKQLNALLKGKPAASVALAQSASHVCYNQEKEAEALKRELELIGALPLKRLSLYGGGFDKIIPSWLKSLPRTTWEELRLTGGALPLSALEVLHTHPERFPLLAELHWSLPTKAELAEGTSHQPLLARVTSLELPARVDNSKRWNKIMDQLFQSPQLTQVHSITTQHGYHHRSISQRSLTHWRQAPLWEQIKSLSLGYPYSSGLSLDLLCELAKPQLETLSISLANEDLDAILQWLTEEAEFETLRSLSFEWGNYTTPQLERLASWPGLKQLTHLKIAGEANAAGLDKLLHAPHWGALKSIHLPTYGLKQEERLRLHHKLRSDPFFQKVSHNL